MHSIGELMFKNKTILITGGTGSWGKELTRQLIQSDVKEIRIFSRGELAQVTMQREFNNKNISYIIGDIRDKTALIDALVGVDYVFHLAALKHVPICEFQPQEAIKTNVLGTMNIIDASITRHVKKVIYVSTDKAVSAVNLYGMSKGMGERLIIEANLHSDTSFTCIRTGNVLGSNGSVIPLFKEQLQLTNQVTLTHKNMTRYFVTIPDAVSFLIKAAKESNGGDIYVMSMPACKIIDLAKAVIKLYGNNNSKIVEIGIRPGEKMHEELISASENGIVYQYDNDYYIVHPTYLPKEHKKQLETIPGNKLVNYSVSSNIESCMTIPELINLIQTSNL